jgi:hypothetical protein
MTTVRPPGTQDTDDAADVIVDADDDGQLMVAVNQSSADPSAVALAELLNPSITIGISNDYRVNFCGVFSD